ncbi:MAG TPA: NAD(P)/FAD-dependent oxidoreductase, partial [Flavisolibacter sp.]|nr:NAD(P)/FAD-dependent oxidoreductase [Flavisolibacter sp.]
MNKDMEYNYDVGIIGAGASGLMAGLELTLAGRKVIVLEARDRPGGRMHTVQKYNFTVPVESGAEFIHGKLEMTLHLLDKAGIPYYPVEGSAWQKRKNALCQQEDFIEDFDKLKSKFDQLDVDLSVADFIESYLNDPELENLRFTVKNYVEGYYAADLHKASTFALRQELTQSDDEQFRIEGGYVKLVEYLVREMADKGGLIIYNHLVEEVNWETSQVIIKAGGKRIVCSQVLSTIPLGVWQDGCLPFVPALTEKVNLAKKLGSGNVIKILLQFKEPFWHWPEITQGNDLKSLGFLFSNEKIPTWWTQYPKNSNVLTGWLGGPPASDMQDETEDELIDRALQSLVSIFQIERKALDNLLMAATSVNWMKDAFTRGGYSYEVVNGAAIQERIA